MFGHGGANEREARVRRAGALVEDVLSIDPRTATGAELSRLMEARAELVALADGAAVAAMSPWECSRDWVNDGSATAVSWQVNHTGAHRSTAGALRRTGLDAASMPHVMAAAVDGRLPLSHLHQLTRARKPEVAEIFDRDEADLVTEAQTLTADALADRLEAWRLGALAQLERNEPDGAPPDPETDGDTASIVRGFFGRGIVRCELTVESLQMWIEAVETRIDKWRRAGALEGDDRTYGELVGTALTELIADGAASTRRGMPRPLLIAIARLTELFDQANVDADDRTEWTARILGGGPIGKAALRELTEKANLVLVITDDDDQPLHVGRARRLATAAMLLALIARSGGRCEFPSCHANHHRCHAHHIRWWRNGGLTDILNLALLCPHHHRLVHHGWTLTRGPTGLEFRQPDGTLHTPPTYGHAA